MTIAMEPAHRAPRSAAGELPLLIEPAYAGEPLAELLGHSRARIERELLRVGGVLLRGFDVASTQHFHDFAAGFGHPLLKYEFGSTPRSAVSAGIYTSTEYPAHQHIPLHNEQAYTREWPMKIWFHCVTPSPSGGETPIADSRAICRRMPARIRERFAQGLVYVRHYGEFDVPWQQVFGTDVPAEVEAYCARARIDCRWLDDSTLRTRQRVQGLARHPVTGDEVWFNQAHLFHASNLPADVRESLIELLGADRLPRNVYFADGSEIGDTMLAEVRAVLDSEAVVFPWQAGDVLMLDNMLTAHARRPFGGARRVVVAMAEPYGLDAMQGAAS